MNNNRKPLIRGVIRVRRKRRRSLKQRRKRRNLRRRNSVSLKYLL
jgi:hypothetical protein